jgi:hypothetical protein
MKQVKTLEYLVDLQIQKKSVFVPTWYGFTKHKPAKFMMNLQGWILWTMMRKGMYVYEPKKKVKKSIRKGFKNAS